MKDKKNILKLTTRVHSRLGFISFVLGVLSILLFCIAVLISAFEDRSQESVQYTIGILEMIAIVFNVTGIVYGVVGETKVDNLRFFAHTGLIVNGLAILVHISVLLFSYSFS